jgi:hypothetical protein
LHPVRRIRNILHNRKHRRLLANKDTKLPPQSLFTQQTIIKNGEDKNGSDINITNTSPLPTSNAIVSTQTPSQSCTDKHKTVTSTPISNKITTTMNSAVKCQSSTPHHVATPNQQTSHSQQRDNSSLHQHASSSMTSNSSTTTTKAHYIPTPPPLPANTSTLPKMLKCKSDTTYNRSACENTNDHLYIDQASLPTTTSIIGGFAAQTASQLKPTRTMVCDESVMRVMRV